MSKLVAIVAALLAASCAVQRDEIAPAAAEANAAPPALVARVDSTPTVAEPGSEAVEVKTVAIGESEGEDVCESRSHAGSRIAKTICYTRDESATGVAQARQREQAQRYARDLARDQEWREQQRALEEQQRQSAAAVIGR